MRTRSKLSILLSVLLCCTMLAGLLPTVAFAEDSTTVSSENGADTSSKNGADTTSENGAGTSSENGTAAPSGAPSVHGWGNRIPDIGGGGKCRCKR